MTPQRIAEVLDEMLTKLENRGECRYVYHDAVSAVLECLRADYPASPRKGETA